MPLLGLGSTRGAGEATATGCVRTRKATLSSDARCSSLNQAFHSTSSDSSSSTRVQGVHPISSGYATERDLQVFPASCSVL